MPNVSCRPAWISASLLARSRASRCRILLVRQHRHIRRERFAPLAADEQQVIRRPSVPSTRSSSGISFSRAMRPAKIRRRVSGARPSSSRSAGSAHDGWKDRAVDAERLDRDVRDAEIAEPFGDQPARREHAVEAPIEMLEVKRRRAHRSPARSDRRTAARDPNARTRRPECRAVSATPSTTQAGDTDRPLRSRQV